MTNKQIAENFSKHDFEITYPFIDACKTHII
jgi:hypothetical protein